MKIVRDLDPKANIVIWSDMFDPNHNAVDRYYAVNGSLKGSWEGLPADVTIVNWNSGKAADSLKFFAGRGHKQILAGFYDQPHFNNEFMAFTGFSPTQYLQLRRRLLGVAPAQARFLGCLFVE